MKYTASFNAERRQYHLDSIESGATMPRKRWYQTHEELSAAVDEAEAKEFEFGEKEK